jgi:leucyl/phenylalanyl-tRNA--protein transferase
MLTWLASPDDPLPDTCHALPAGSEAPGLVAAGEDLSPRRLAEAYARGIFPWYSQGQPVLWWSPDPRMVLPVAEFKLSHSLRKTLRRFIAAPQCQVRIDHDFPAVIHACATTPRDGQDGTWIQPELQAAYGAWHRLGAVHSFETWIDGRLVGGLYGVNLGRMFFGESMFSHATDASKIALAALVAFCRAHGIALIDCQQRTAHLGSLGAREIDRPTFEGHLARTVVLQPPEDWTYDESHWTHLGLETGPVPASSSVTETSPRPAAP